MTFVSQMLLKINRQTLAKLLESDDNYYLAKLKYIRLK